VKLNRRRNKKSRTRGDIIAWRLIDGVISTRGRMHVAGRVHKRDPSTEDAAAKNECFSVILFDRKQTEIRLSVCRMSVVYNVRAPY